MDSFSTTTASPEASFAILALLGVILIPLLILGLVSYILTAVGAHQMAKNEGINNPWMAWIPVASSWTLGEIISEKLKGNGGLKVLLFTVLAGLIEKIPYVGWYIVLAGWIFIVFALVSKYTESKALHTVLSCIIPLYFPIFIFVHRNKPALY
jgi:FtsH-binding integral membrane protein